jgi:hypothetical protein
MPLTPLHHSIAMASKSGCAAVCAARKRALGPSMYWEERQLRARHLAQVPLVAGEARRRRELDGMMAAASSAECSATVPKRSGVGRKSDALL